MPQVAARVTPEHEKRLKEFFKTKSAGAEFILPWAMEMFAKSLHQLKNELSPGELKTVIEAYKSVKVLPEHCKKAYLQLRIQEACDELLVNTKHGASKGSLERKLGRMSDIQAVTLIVWASAFWISKLWKDTEMDEYLKQ